MFRRKCTLLAWFAVLGFTTNAASAATLFDADFDASPTTTSGMIAGAADLNAGTAIGSWAISPGDGTSGSGTHMGGIVDSAPSGDKALYLDPEYGGLVDTTQVRGDLSSSTTIGGLNDVVEFEWIWSRTRSAGGPNSTAKQARMRVGEGSTAAYTVVWNEGNGSNGQVYFVDTANTLQQVGTIGGGINTDRTTYDESLSSISKFKLILSGASATLEVDQGNDSSVDLTTTIGRRNESVSIIDNLTYFFAQINGQNKGMSVDDVLVNTSTAFAEFVEWGVDADGDWDPTAGSNWVGGVTPNSSTVVAGFEATTITEPRTVTVTDPISVNGLAIQGTNQYTIADDGSNSLTLAGTSPFVQVNSGTHEVAATVAGSAGMIKSGAGTLLLSGTNTYTGTTDVQGGTLLVTNSGAVPGALNIATGATAQYEADGLVATISADITGEGHLEIGADPSLATKPMVTLPNAKTFDGSINVDEGTLRIQNSDSLGTTTGSTSVLGGQTGVLELDGSGGALTVADDILLGGRSGTASFGANAHLRNVAGNNTLTGAITTSNSNFTNVEIASGTTLTVDNSFVTPATMAKQGGNLRFQGDGNVVIGNAATPGSGKLIGTGNVVKQGTGTLTIATALNSTDPNDYFTGRLTIEEGTVEVLSSGNDGELQASSIEIQSGSTLDIDSFGTYTAQVGQTIGGSGTIAGGSSTFRYDNEASLSPGDSVGTLNINANVVLDTFVSVSTGFLNYELASVNTVGSGVNDLIDVTGNLTITSGAGETFQVNVTPVDASLATGDYRLIDYSGSLSGGGTGSDFDVKLVDARGDDYGPVRQTFAVSTATSGEVNLQVSGSAANKTWVGTDGSNPTFWDIDTTANWTAGGGDNNYLDLDVVTFDDTGTKTVDIQADVRPGNVTFDNTTGNDYVVNGSGVGISGDAEIIKNNTGTVTLNSENSNQGGITVNSGTLVLAGINQNARGDITVAPGATLQVGDGTTTGNTFPDGPPLVTVNGELVHNEDEREGYSTIGGTGVLRVLSGEMALTAADNTYSGGTIIDGGRLDLEGTSSPGTGTVTVNAGGELLAEGRSHSVSNAIVLNGGQIRVGGGANSAFTLSGPVSLTADSAIVSNGDTGADGLTMSGNITGASNLEIRADGNATINFTGSIGTTGQILKTSGGTAALTGTGTITSPLIDVAGGNLRVTGTTSGALALSGQTLSGEAEVTGDVTTTANSVIRIGDAGLTATSNLIGHWTFDTDGSDSALAPNPATLGASASIDNVNFQAGGGSLALTDPNDNNGNRAETPGFAGVTGDGARTYSFWFKSSVTQEANATLIGAGSDPGTGTRFDIRMNGGDMRVEIAGNGFNFSETPAGIETDNQWHHVAVTLPEGGSFANVELFFDGVELNDGGIVSGAAINTSVADLFFGDSHNGGPNRNFFGNIDDIQHYDIELSPAQILTLFNNPGQDLGLPLNFEPVDFEITGDLTLDSTATLEFDLGDTTGFDSLIVGGQLTAAGTLDVNLDASFNPQDGDTFDILDFTTAVGGFDSFDLPSLDPGLSWDTSDLLTTGELSVTTGLPGDFNGDGKVDGLDFLVWQRDDGSASGLTDWINNYGTGSPTVPNAAVPEPGSLVLLAMFGLTAACGRRRRR